MDNPWVEKSVTFAVLREEVQDSNWLRVRVGVEIPLKHSAKNFAAFLPGSNTAQPLSITAGDFDGDYVPDIICGLASGATGLLTLHRGNPEALYKPVAQRITETGQRDPEPFPSPTKVFALPIAPDFLGAGDFNNDGKLDIVAANRGGSVLYILPGDGKGAFLSSKNIPLPGGVSAMAVGEINRRDGLADIVVAVMAENGPALLVFESPMGALRSEPEHFALPAEAICIELGAFDGDAFYDCAVAAGKNLVVIYGRDRRLSLAPGDKARVPPAVVSRCTLDASISGIAVGDFIGDRAREMAILTEDGVVHFMGLLSENNLGKAKTLAQFALVSDKTVSKNQGITKMTRVRISASPKDDLVLLNSEKRLLRVLMNPPTTGLEPEPTRIITTEDETEGNRRKQKSGGSASSPPNFQAVTLNVAEEPIAILPMRLNLDSLDDLVILKRGDTSPLAVAMTLAASTFVVTDSGDAPDSDLSDDVFSPRTLRSAIQNANKTQALDSITFSLPAGTVIRPATQLPNATSPISINGSLGTGPDGKVQRVEIDGSLMPDGSEGIVVRNDSTVANLRITNCPSIGIALVIDNGNNTIQGNEAIFNEGPGININSDGNTIGGLTATPGDVPGNWSAGNKGGSGQGIAIVSGDDNVVQGNLVGTNRAGDAPTSNATAGIFVKGLRNRIGGTEDGARNVISGNEFYGIEIYDVYPKQTVGTIIQGNYIGTNISGDKPIEMQKWGGIALQGGTDTTIGGTADSASNVIGGNKGNGISMTNTTPANPITGTLVQGNYIGIDKTELIALPNQAGVGIGERDNVVGGAVPETRNIIAYNRSSGVYTYGEAGGPPVKVIGNYIGTDSVGRADRGNGGSGVYMTGTNTVIGGATEGEGNLICWNGGDGIQMRYSPTDIVIEGNVIGTDSVGDQAQPNARNGIQLLWGPHHNTIRNNLISGNGENGIKIFRDPDDSLHRNANDNKLEGNRIGVNKAGNATMPNQKNGILIDDCTSTTITSAPDGTMGIISGNTENGIEICGPEARLNLVEKTLIGTDNNGSKAIPNGANGIFITRGAHNNSIGGNDAEHKNVISGNTENGIKLSQDLELLANHNFINTNFIGTDLDGKLPIPNKHNGILIRVPNNYVGGGWYKCRNVISGNGENGIAIEGWDAKNNEIEQNYIGTDASGKTDIPNGQNGILIHNATDNKVGETVNWMIGHHNVIAGNRGCGVKILGDPGDPIKKGKNVIEHNFIGLTSEWKPLGNNGQGVLINNASQNKVIYNDIGDNMKDGVAVVSVNEAQQNLIYENNIYENGGLGIDLGDNGVTPNDPNDADKGANLLQNFPEINATVTTGTADLVITGSLHSSPNTNYDVEFFWSEDCDPSNYGEGHYYIGFKTARTDANGYARISVKFPGYGMPGVYITATAIDPNDNTSEFSECASVVTIKPPSGDLWLAY